MEGDPYVSGLAFVAVMHERRHFQKAYGLCIYGSEIASVASASLGLVNERACLLSANTSVSGGFPNPRSFSQCQWSGRLPLVRLAMTLASFRSFSNGTLPV